MRHNISRRLQLIALDWTRPKDPPLSLGHASICAFAKKSNINYDQRSWSVNSPHFSAKEVSNYIMNSNKKNSDVAFGVYIWNENEIQKILNNLKSDSFMGRIMLGGPQISYTKQNLELLYPQADVFIRGYAENALIELMNMTTPTSQFPSIPGVHFAHQTDLNTKATVSLEDLPSPYLDGLIPPQRFIRWETQRGCKFRCSFCQHREPDKALSRTKHISVTRIQQEIEWILANPIIQDIAVLDPVFNSGPHYLDIL